MTLEPPASRIASKWRSGFVDHQVAVDRALVLEDRRRDRLRARSARSSPAGRSARRRRRSGRRARRSAAASRSARRGARSPPRRATARPRPCAPSRARTPQATLWRATAPLTHAQPRDEEAARAVDVRQRQQELGPASDAGTAATRRRASGRPRGPRASTTRFVLVGVERADAVDDRAAGLTRARRRGAARAEAPAAAARASAGPDARARTPRPEHGASTSARSKPSSSGGRAVASAWTTRDVRRAEPADVLLELTRARLVHLDGRHVAAQHRRLAAGRGAAVEDSLAVAGRRRRAPRAASHGSAARAGRPRAPARRRARRGTRRARPSARRRSRRARARTTVSGGSFCARISASAASSPKSRTPDLEDPVGIRVLERALRELVEQSADPLGEAAHDRVRERHGSLEPRGADELDRLVRGRVRSDVEVAELVRAETERMQAPAASSLRTGRRPSVSIAWSSVRTRCTVPYASCCANARSRASRFAVALRSARSAYASCSNTRRTTSNAARRAGETLIASARRRGRGASASGRRPRSSNPPLPRRSRSASKPASSRSTSARVWNVIRRVGGPLVAVAEELAAEAAAGPERVADPRPELLEPIRGTERQREARVDEVARGQNGVLERSDLRLEPLVAAHGRAQATDRLLLRSRSRERASRDGAARRCRGRCRNRDRRRRPARRSVERVEERLARIVAGRVVVARPLLHDRQPVSATVTGMSRLIAGLAAKRRR